MPDLESRVAVVETVISENRPMLARLEKNIDKLGEISASLKEIVSVHENQIGIAKNERTDLYAITEQIQRDSIHRDNNLSTKLEGLKNDIDKKFDSVKEDMKQDNEAFSEEIKKVVGENTDRKIEFEKVKWIVIGAVLFVLVLLGKSGTI